MKIISERFEYKTIKIPCKKTVRLRQFVEDCLHDLLTLKNQQVWNIADAAAFYRNMDPKDGFILQRGLLK